MKGIFCFLFVLLFVQGTALAKELSLYEEFDPQVEFKLEENKIPNETETKNTQEKQNADGAVSENSIPANTGETAEFFMTDEKHAQFLGENEQYALADAMLNQTWKLLVQKLNKKAYRKLWQNHKVWLDTGRNTVANSFKEQVPQIPEYHAFMLAAVAKTQELAQSLWHEPVLGRYVKGDTFVTLTKEEEKFFLQGYGSVLYLMNTAANENKAENTDNASERSDTAGKSAHADEQSKKEPADTSINLAEADKNKTMPQLLFRAELPENGKLWLALATVNDQKLYLLTLKDSLCIVYTPALFPVDFNGVFVKK